MATRADIVAGALRELGILSASETPTADEEDHVGGVLDDALAHAVASQGFVFDWSLAADDVPASYARPLALLAASEAAPHYGVNGPVRSRAIAMIRALAFPDDRPPTRDADGDGIVTDAEDAASLRATYF